MPTTRAQQKILDKEIDFNRKDELKSFIESEFQDFDLVLEWKRNETQQDWINTYNLLDDELIWFCCNHDHIFMDSSTEHLNYLTI